MIAISRRSESAAALLRALISAVLVALAPALLAEETGMNFEPQWQYVSDRVMGGVSTGGLEPADGHAGQGARLTGQVSLDNNGGFVQMAFDVPDALRDASGWTGLEVDVFGNGETYDIRLRTSALTRPWQSFRVAFTAHAEMRTIKVPFSRFEAHRTDAIFDPSDLRRIGILAIGRRFQADVTVTRIGYYRD